MAPQTPPADRSGLNAPASIVDWPSGSRWCGARSESVNVPTRPDRPRVHETLCDLVCVRRVTRQPAEVTCTRCRLALHAEREATERRVARQEAEGRGNE